MYHFKLSDAQSQARGFSDADKYGWDERDLDHPDIEWVPTHALKPFMEYNRRPGSKDAWSSKERWEALGEHIKANGITKPLWIDFNPHTSTGHLSEGNHRLQLALDHGIPALPVRVMQSQRQSPTQVPLQAIAQPEWADHRGETHWPTYMRASHVGLPIVPAPDQVKTASNPDFYHVAPASAREAILRQGLRGHEGYGGDVKSPWGQSLGQPAGNYMYDDFDNAMHYVPTLASRMHPRGVYPGDAGGFEDDGVYPHQYGDYEAHISPTPPLESSEWNDEQWEHWYDTEEERAIPYDHTNPEHRNKLLPHMQGVDVWKVNTNGLPIEPDPENLLQERNWKESPILHGPSDWGEPKNPWDLEPPDPNVWDEDNHPEEPPRWLTRHPVDPARLTLEHHVPGFAINDDFADEVHDEGSPVTRDWTLIHPRQIAPRYDRLPPEHREIWGSLTNE